MKKIFALIIGLTMLMSFTVGCSANEDAWKNNTGNIDLSQMSVTGDGIKVEGNTVKITKGGDFTVIGECSDGMIYVNTEEKVKLRLSGMSLTNNDGPAIFFENADKGFITITENTENFLADGKEYATEDADAVLFSNDDLEIKGDGTLSVTGNYKHGIASDDDLNIENGTIAVKSYEHGIKVNDTLHITGGDISVTTETGKGMKVELEVLIDEGTININSFDEGIESKGLLTVNGGDISIISQEDGMNTGNSSTTAEETTENPADGVTPPEIPEGEMPGKGFGGGRGQRPDMGQMPEGMTPPDMPEGMTPPENSGEMPTMPEGTTPPERPEGGRGFGGGMGGGFDMVDEETAAAHAITINGGKIYIKAAGDGIDSNGNLTISGGEVIIDGPEDNGNSALDSQGTMTISGGTVFTASSKGMMQLPRESAVCIALVDMSETRASGTKVEIKDADGNVVYTHTPAANFRLITFASPDLTEGEQYAVYLDGEEYQLFTASKETAGGIGGGFGGGMRPVGNRGQKDITVSVDGANVNFDSKPVIRNDSTLVGFRAILEALGATVEWDEETRTVTATKDDTVIVLEIGSYTATVNGIEYQLLAAPEIINDRTMVPVRFMSENLNMNVEWNEQLRHININSK